MSEGEQQKSLMNQKSAESGVTQDTKKKGVNFQSSARGNDTTNRAMGSDASQTSLQRPKKEKKPKAKKLYLPITEGKFIKTKDTIRMSPRDFLRIGKVQKEHEEPLTEAQVKHRDRSYII